MPNYRDERAPDDLGKPILGCTFELFSLKQSRDGGFGSTVFARSPQVERVPCSMAKQGSRWAEFQRAAQKQVEGAKKGPRDIAVIPDDEDWDGPPGSSRAIRFRLYRFDQVVDHERSVCNERSRKVVCEASGSKSAKAINMMHWHLAAAQQSHDRRNFEGCVEYTSWTFSFTRGIVKFRDAQKVKQAWKDGFLYKTRWDGLVTEEQLFKKAESFAERAKALSYKCGQPEPRVTESLELMFLR